MTTLTIQAAEASTSAPSPAPQFSRIILTGFMGAGKSTVGRILAERLGWTFIDLDTLIEDRANAKVPSIFAEHGEKHFRRLESSALASALRTAKAVIALGGGAPESLTNRLLLEQTPGTATIFLDAPFPALYDRCVLQDLSRPNLADPIAAQSRYTQRHPLYRRLASLTVQTAEQTPEQTAAQILSSLA